MKRTLLILTMSLCLLLGGCTRGYEVNSFKYVDLEISALAYNQVEQINYYALSSYNIQSLEELQATIKDEEILKSTFSKYDNAFFKNQTLILIAVADEGNHHYNSANLKNGTIGVFAKRIVNNETTTSRKGIVLMEVQGKVKRDWKPYITLNSDSSKN